MRENTVTKIDKSIGWLLALANCQVAGKVMDIKKKEFHLLNEGGTWEITTILDWDKVNHVWFTYTTCPEAVFMCHQ